MIKIIAVTNLVTLTNVVQNVGLHELRHQHEELQLSDPLPTSITCI